MTIRLILTCLLVSSFPIRSIAQSNPYEDSPFGFHPAGPPYEDARSIGVRWTRGGGTPYLFWSLVDSGMTGDSSRFRWRGVTIGPDGLPVAHDYDMILAARDAGLNILHNIDVQPEPLLTDGYRLPGSWLPKDTLAYKRFVTAAVRRYPFIRYWQVGNEPNMFPPNRTLTGYADLQRITYEAIKEGNPTARVLMAGLAGNMSVADTNDRFYETVLPLLGGKYIDVFDIHFYGDARCGALVNDPERRLVGYRDFKRVHAYFRNLLDRNGFADVPIWVTEMGTFSGTVPGLLELTQTEADQARDVIKRWVYPLSLGVEKVFWAFGLYEGLGQWDNDFFDHTGFVYGGQDGVHPIGTRKLSYYTHRLMTQKLEGSEWSSVERVKDDSVKHVYVFRFNKHGVPMYVAWWDFHNDANYQPGTSRQIRFTPAGVSTDSLLLTEAVPNVLSGSDVVSYETAFDRDTLIVSSGEVTLTLAENPVFIEELNGGRIDPQRVVYVLFNNHIEGDGIPPPGDPLCLSDTAYQVLPPPPIGVLDFRPSFAIDVIGTRLLRERTNLVTDSYGNNPKWLQCPTGEFWQTEADSVYGRRLFEQMDFLALGDEFGIQGHPIYYAGERYCWYPTPHTIEGIDRKLRDLDTFANLVYDNGRKVNHGATLTGGHKIEAPTLGAVRAEKIIDSIAYSLGYRISYEDHDGHIEDEPDGIGNARPSYYVYEAEYLDGVRIVKIDMNGGLSDDCGGNTARCETSAEAIERFDNTVAARLADPDTTRVYYFAVAVHANAYFAGKHEEASRVPVLPHEYTALNRFLDTLQQRIHSGVRVKFVTPSGLAAIFHAYNPTTSVDSNPMNDPDESGRAPMLEQNYPNPFNPSTTIHFTIPPHLHVTLKIFDVLGREVATLVDGELNPGEHSVVFDAIKLPDGVYFYQLRSERFVETKKLVLMR